MLRFATVAALACIAAAEPRAAHAQAVIPSPPLDGLIERAEGWQALPRQRPTIAETFATSCVPAHPELAFAALPRPLREVPFETMVGQLLVTSYSGKRADDPGVLAARNALARSLIGGVITFRHNIGTAADVAAVNEVFGTANGELPAMIAVDQEGGEVMRLTPAEGAPDTPRAKTLGAGSLVAAREAYDAVAQTLAGLGFTANFGPVVDLEVNPQNPVVARFGRAYGADPRKVARFAETFLAAHRREGVGTATKHFPGHGSSSADSHAGPIDVSSSWRREELIPFRDLIATGGLDMVMVGHLTLDGLTGDVPASLSPSAIDAFLRDTLCFSGVVVADDLAMAAVATQHDALEAVRLFVKAGGDIAQLSTPPGDGFERIAQMVTTLADEARADQAFGDKVRHAYARVAHHKLDLQRVRAPSRTASAEPHSRLR